MDSDSNSYLKPTGAQTRKSPGFTSRSEPLLANVEPEAADSTPSPNLAPNRRSWFQNLNLNLFKFKSKPSAPTGVGSSIQSSNTAFDLECPVPGQLEEVSRLPGLGYRSLGNLNFADWQWHRSTGFVSRSTSPVSESASELDDIPSPPGAFQSFDSLAHSLVNDPVAPESITVDESPSPGQGRSHVCIRDKEVMAAAAQQPLTA